ncbi:MAG TPA: hypothetical protein VIY56_04015 [Vicinamibacterales bacterium]
MRTALSRVAAVVTALAATIGLQAAVPTFWQVATETEFLRGDVDGLSIDSYGRLALGPVASTVYDSTAPFLWALAPGPDGGSFVGTGNEGQVLLVDAAGRGRVFFDADELEVHALAPAPNGGLFVGTSPNGKVYRVDPSGTGTVFFDPPDPYIWSLTTDRTGNLFVATGDKGLIYKIAPDGRGAVFYDTKATHALSLAFDRDGRLLAGTGTPGRVFQLDATGKPFVLYDSPYSEIRGLRVDAAGAAFAIAVAGRTGGGSAEPIRPADPTPAPAPVASVSTEITVVAVGDVSGSVGSSQAPQARAQGPVSGAVVRIAPEGGADVVWEAREDTPYDVAFETDGSIVVATGGKGKIFRLAGDPLRPTLIARANAQQVTALGRDRDGQLVFATSNPGKVQRLSRTRATRGTYTSEVRDAQTVAAWGAIKWQALTPGAGKVEVSTRSGNTRTPDETWSDWSAPYGAADGSAISSPRARYLQWRAVLLPGGTETPILTSVTAAYLPRNARPRVTSVTIQAPGTVFQRPFPTGEPEIAGFDGDTPDRRVAAQQQSSGVGGSPSLGRRGYERGLLTFMWRAEDENRDELTYDVQYRREGDTSWRPLKRGLTDTILVWDTTSVPNGRYVVRVVATDSPSNSPATALTGEMESSAFDVDNLAPTISVTSSRREGTRTTIVFEVRDDLSAVQRVDYSLDGDRWIPVYPKDGIADSRAEQFELTVEDPGGRAVVLRAADALNNVSSARGEAPAAAAGSGRR